MNTTPYIYLRSGRRVNPLDPDPAVLTVQDVAHALTCCNRFAGHCAEPISVAQHSVYVARLVASRLGTRWKDDPTDDLAGATLGVAQETVMQALLHDAAEALLGDVTKWLKATPEMAGYRAAEARVQAVIYRWAGLPTEDHPAVEWADRVMVRYEMLRGWADVDREGITVGGLCPERDKDYPPLTPEELAAIGPWEFWGWRRAKREFLQLYDELSAVRGKVKETTATV